MKKKIFAGVLILALFFVGANITVAQDSGTVEQLNDPPNTNAPMSISVGGSSAEEDLGPWDGGAIPEGFRGTPEGVTNVLEDMNYFSYEHSPIFDADIAGETQEELGAPAGSTFVDSPEGEGPSIGWVTTDEDEQWEMTNNNLARMGRDFPEPGNYVITNAGSRQVSFPLTTEEEADRDTVSITANASVGVVAHDVTPPDLWIAIQEVTTTDANTDLAADLEDAMKQQMEKHKVAGLPLSDTEIVNLPLLRNASVMAIYEYPHQAKPAEKGGAVTLWGDLFTDRKVLTRESEVHDNVDMTRKVVIHTEDEANALYVRRNVPFVVAAATTDNSFNREAVMGLGLDNVESGADGFYIYSDDADALERIVRGDDGSFMFRVPNYPRAEYSDQPEYKFMVRSTDEYGNKVEVTVPLYVVSTRVYYEGGQR